MAIFLANTWVFCYPERTFVRQILNHWTTREIGLFISFAHFYWGSWLSDWVCMHAFLNICRILLYILDFNHIFFFWKLEICSPGLSLIKLFQSCLCLQENFNLNTVKSISLYGFCFLGLNICIPSKVIKIFCIFLLAVLGWITSLKNRYAEILTPSSPECAFIWKQSGCRCNELNEDEVILE